MGAGADGFAKRRDTDAQRVATGRRTRQCCSDNALAGQRNRLRALDPADLIGRVCVTVRVRDSLHFRHKPLPAVGIEPTRRYAQGILSPVLVWM